MSSKMASVDRFLGRRFPDRVNRTFVIQIILIVAVAGIILLAERFSNDDSWITRDELGNKAALFIDFNNTQRMFTGEVVGGMTILDALNASTAAGKIELTYHVDDSNSTKVTEINDHKADDEKQFAFYINSRQIDPDKLNKTQVHPGDKITIKLE